MMYDYDGPTEPPSVLCEACNGPGFTGDTPCIVCHGQGDYHQFRQLDGTLWDQQSRHSINN